ncbi:MAG: copper transporter [Actinobacteria bacterium]|nr:copper transporter [Actinomycetota bacterium]MBO0838000.1 copper transporter [Actinomycetota bacterium]
MIDFRYHLVSAITWFLALAVGLFIGATALTGTAEQALSAAQHRALNQNGKLTKQNRELRQEVAADEAFAQASAGRLLPGLLTGERVVLVTAPGANGAVTSGLTNALRQAGATVTGQVSLTASFTATTGQNEASLSDLAQSLASAAGVSLTTPSTALAGQQAAAQVLAASLVGGTSGLTSTESQAILNGLSRNGLITINSGGPVPPPAGLAILIAPGTPQPQSTSAVLLAVAQELKAAGGGTVIAGPVSSTASNNVISAVNSAGNAVSTVDNADTESGQIMVVWALRLLLDGKSPKAYGLGSGLSPSPAPTPAVASAPKTTTSAPVKGH